MSKSRTIKSQATQKVPSVKRIYTTKTRARTNLGVVNFEAVLVDTQKRGYLFSIFFMLIFIILIAMSFWGQVVKSNYWTRYGEKQYLRTEKKEGQRGNILDRQGTMLAMSEPFALIEAEPIQFSKAVARYKSAESIRSLEKRIQELAVGLKMGVGELKSLLYSKRSYVILAKDIQPQIAEAILAKPIPAVRIKEYQSRIYPNGESSAQLIGLLNKHKNVGEDGLELIYERRLKSISGLSKLVRDPSGRVLEFRDFRASHDGESINISIDSRIQQYAFTALADMVNLSKARDGAVVVMDTISGEVLALAGYPSYDPNNRKDIDLLSLRNIAVTDIFEPGSTIKPFFAALALENNLVEPSTKFDLQGGEITISGHKIKDSHPLPKGTKWSVENIIVRSSNVGIIKVSEQLERKEMWSMLDQLGFGKPMPFSLPGSVSGRFNNFRRWAPLDKATITFGSTLSTNLMQMARAYSVFTRNGEVVQPTLQYSPRAARGKKVFSSKTIQQMNKILQAVVDEGTGKKAQIAGYRVAGKTGTAKKFIKGKYAEKYLSTFVGFAPVSQPRLLVAVMINDPSPESSAGYYGGQVSAPVFAQVMAHALRLMDVKPDRPMGQKGINILKPTIAAKKENVKPEVQINATADNTPPAINIRTKSLLRKAALIRKGL